MLNKKIYKLFCFITVVKGSIIFIRFNNLNMKI